ncbi:MAG TPA: mannose-1-phosphate guanylyltransferase [Bacillota bacterium]|nr:mannose-1-phosphate guanylyltransferase [Bacillota bacterium]
MLNFLIMAGGKGERFWPKSRTNTPKQLLNLTGNSTMIQETVERISDIAEPSHIFIVTNSLYAGPIQQLLPEIPQENIIIEPEGRNTAPCVGLASLVIGSKDPDGTMVVLAADHTIKDKHEFCRLLQQGAEIAAKTGGIVTLGIKPDRPETGYGYIKMGQPHQDFDQAFAVERFTEKPNFETTLDFLATGKYLWNSGMFIWKIATIRRLIQRFMPDLHHGLEKIGEALGTPAYYEVLRSEFVRFEKISIDYGIMERAPEVYVLPADIGWDDVGSWNSLERVRRKDSAGNIVIDPNTILVDVEDCIIESTGEKLVAALGVENLVYVETPDAVLICPKNRTQDIKLILEKIRAEKREEYL